MSSTQNTDKARPEWLDRLERWKTNGVCGVMERLVSERETVLVKRSSGEMQDCIVEGCGHAGLSTTVSFDDGEHEHRLSKTVDTQDFIAWNAALFPMEPTI